MSGRDGACRALHVFAVLAGIAATLPGCQGFREATGAARLAPDEFLVITKSPLIIPPDFNLRPPTPGAPDANRGTTADMARAALFGRDPQAAATALRGNFSAGERNLLARTRGSIAEPEVRQAISNDSGLVDQGRVFAERIIAPAGGAESQFATASAPAAAAIIRPALPPDLPPPEPNPDAPASSGAPATNPVPPSVARPSVVVAAPVAAAAASLAVAHVALATAPSRTPHAAAVLLQLGAYSSEDRANDAWRSFRARHGTIAASLHNDIRAADIPDRGTLYRLRIGPFADRTAAVAICSALKAEGGACLVANP